MKGKSLGVIIAVGVLSLIAIILLIVYVSGGGSLKTEDIINNEEVIELKEVTTEGIVEEKEETE